MWVFDGEQWTEEGGSSEQKTKVEQVFRIEGFQPELQIVEVVPTIPRTNHIPVPLP